MTRASPTPAAGPAGRTRRTRPGGRGSTPTVFKYGVTSLPFCVWWIVSFGSRSTPVLRLQGVGASPGPIACTSTVHEVPAVDVKAADPDFVGGPDIGPGGYAAHRPRRAARLHEVGGG